MPSVKITSPVDLAVTGLSDADLVDLNAALEIAWHGSGSTVGVAKAFLDVLGPQLTARGLGQQHSARFAELKQQIHDWSAPQA